MAQRRMFSLSVTDTDVFLDMPVSTQALYFHLGMHGDDDGFVGSPKKIMRAAGCGNDDLKLLAAKGFIIPFDSGVVVLRDWRLNNTLKNDRYHETLYQSEKALVSVDSVGRYQLGTGLEPTVFQPGSNVEPEHNITELNKTEQNKADKAAKPPTHTRFTPPTVDDVTAYCRERGNEIDPQRFVDFYAAKGWKIGKEAMKDWKAAVRTWERGDTRRPTPPPADLSWRKSGKDDAPGEVIEWPPGSGSYRLRQEVNADG